jgi:hypothetical protein
MPDHYDERLCNSKHEGLMKIVALSADKLKTRLDGMDIALSLKTQDMDRRLEGLNHLRAEYTRDRMEDRAQYVKTETYEIKTKGYDEWTRIVDNRLMKMETQYASRISFATTLSVFSAIIALLGVVIPWLLHK